MGRVTNALVAGGVEAGLSTNSSEQAINIVNRYVYMTGSRLRPFCCHTLLIKYSMTCCFSYLHCDQTTEDLKGNRWLGERAGGGGGNCRRPASLR